MPFELLEEPFSHANEDGASRKFSSTTLSSVVEWILLEEGLQKKLYVWTVRESRQQLPFFLEEREGCLKSDFVLGIFQQKAIGLLTRAMMPLSVSSLFARPITEKKLQSDGWIVRSVHGL